MRGDFPLFGWWWAAASLVGVVFIFAMSPLTASIPEDVGKRVSAGVGVRVVVEEWQHPEAAALEEFFSTTTTTTTVPPTTTTTTTTTTVPLPVVASVRVWSPADECRGVTRRVSARAMRWCPSVAEYLYRTGRWQPGDLTKLMRIIDCESGGVPSAKNPRSTASGLFQFLDGSWARWGPRAASFFGFTNPQVFMPLDNIAAGVLYYVNAGAGPWPNCGKR